MKTFVGQVLVIGGEADADGDQREQEHLPAAPKAERAAVRELDEVVEEPDRAAAERDEEHGQRRHLVLREGEERGGGDDEDQETAHRGRPLLHTMSLGAFFADVLSELVPAQELDELRADEDRHHHRDHPSGEDVDHAVGTWVSAAATASSPIARDALTRTASPGWTTSSTSCRASWTFATQRPGTPPSR